MPVPALALEPKPTCMLALACLHWHLHTRTRTCQQAHGGKIPITYLECLKDDIDSSLQNGHLVGA